MYPICVDLQFKVISSRRQCTGSGRTTRVGSRAIEFDTDQSIPAGSRLEISVCWPVLLDDRVSLQLVLCGRVTAANPTSARVEFERYNFRTRRPAPPVKQPSAEPPRKLFAVSAGATSPVSMGAHV